MKSAQHLLNEIITEILSYLTEGGAFREGQGEGGEGAMLQATFVGHTANNNSNTSDRLTHLTHIINYFCLVFISNNFVVFIFFV